MSVIRPTLFVFLLLSVFTTGCRIAKDDIPGEYYFVSPDGSESLAADLREDGSYTLYRSFYSDDAGSIEIYRAPGVTGPIELSGSGKWDLKFQTILGPGDEAVELTGRGGAYGYVDHMKTVHKDGRICLYTSGRKEYWCKKK